MVSSTLRILRKANGYTQKQIADKLNIDRSTYSYYELGKINPSISSMVILSDLYGLSLDEMVHYDEAADTTLSAASSPVGYDVSLILSEDEKKLIASYRKLSMAAKEDVLISVINIARDSTE